MIRAALTVEEALEGMKSLEPKIKNYARLVVRKGVNVKPGQEVVVQSPVECASFARVVVAEAYDAGAGHDPHPPAHRLQHHLRLLDPADAAGPAV